MNLYFSAFIVAIIYLIVFFAVDWYYVVFVNKHVGELDMHQQCIIQFSSVFIVTVLLGILEIDLLLCAANH